MAVTHVDIWSTYLSRIENSVGATLFQHLYVTDGKVRADVTNNGELSCAVHVSSVLAMVGLIDRPHATVASTLDALIAAGWTRTDTPQKGSLVIWPQSEDGHEHIGFYISDHEAISNSSKLGVPVAHSLTMEDGRTPEYFLSYEVGTDTRNVVDKYRGHSVGDIVKDLDTSRSDLEIAVENLERDFNMGTIIRSANAFNVRKVHIIGRKQWNKRGAMKTDAYLHIYYYQTPAEFFEAMRSAEKEVIAVDIVEGATPLGEVALPKNAVLVFGSEGPGLSKELLTGASQIVHIEQFGSTRSVNVGVAASIAMYAWIQRHRLTT